MKRWGDPAVLVGDEKLDRVLVPLIPKDARVKMTVLENIVVELGRHHDGGRRPTQDVAT